MTDELPPPDLMDQTGRLRRLAIAFTVGVVVAAIAYGITHAMAADDIDANHYVTSRNATRFVFYMTAFFGGGAFIATLATVNYLAKRKWQRDRDVPKAQIKS